MNNQYYVKDEDGLFRLFDVSHDGLEDAIEVANDIGSDVMRERDGEVELVWSFDESGSSADQEDYDDGLTDVEADAMTLMSAGMGMDEDYGGGSYIDECNDGY
jgi:hypothetical protein